MSESNTLRDDDELNVKIFFIAVMVVSWGLVWLGYEFHEVKTGHYGRDAGALETMAMAIATFSIIPGTISLLSIIRRTIGFGWGQMALYVILPLYLGIWAVALTVTDGW